MLGLGLKLANALAYLPALSPLPPGWAFVTLNGAQLTFAGQYLIAEAR